MTSATATACTFTHTTVQTRTCVPPTRKGAGGTTTARTLYPMGTSTREDRTHHRDHTMMESIGKTGWDTATL